MIRGLASVRGGCRRAMLGATSSAPTPRTWRAPIRRAPLASLLSLAVLVFATGALGQPAEKVRRVTYLGNSSPALESEAAGGRTDVIVTAGTPATLAAKHGTRTITIVVAGMGGPVAAGVVPSLARPGGNVTGLASMTPDIDGKRLELLKELVPGVSRIAVVWNPTNPNNAARLQQMQAAARALHLTLGPLVGAADGRDLEQG